MYIIESHKSIGKLKLNSTPNEIKYFITLYNLEPVKYAVDYLIGFYEKGISVAYKDNFSCYIGVPASLFPIHLNFNFLNKTYLDVLNYFKQYPGDIFIEKDIGIVSKYLGVSAYFEDECIKEVAIFSENYASEIIKGLKVLD